MKQEETLEIIAAALRDRFGAGLRVDRKTKFSDIADSLELFEFVFAIEDKFDLNLPDGWATVGELVDLIEANRREVNLNRSK